MAFRQFSGFRFWLDLWNTWQMRKSERVFWIRDEWLPFSCELCRLRKSEVQFHFWLRVIVLKSSRLIWCNSLPFGELIEAGGGEVFVCLCVHVCGLLQCLVSFIALWHTGIWGKKSELKKACFLLVVIQPLSPFPPLRFAFWPVIWCACQMWGGGAEAIQAFRPFHGGGYFIISVVHKNFPLFF